VIRGPQVRKASIVIMSDDKHGTAALPLYGNIEAVLLLIVL